MPVLPARILSPAAVLALFLLLPLSPPCDVPVRHAAADDDRTDYPVLGAAGKVPDVWLWEVPFVDPWRPGMKAQLWQAPFWSEAPASPPSMRTASGGVEAESAVSRNANPSGAAAVSAAPRPAISPGKAAFRPAGANGQVTQAEVDALEAEVVPALTALEASLVEEVFSETLPLVGDRFAAVWDNNVAGFRFLERLRIAARDGLASLTGGGPFTPVQVQNAINSRLTNAGGGFNTGSRVVVTTADDQVQLAFETVDTFTNVAVPIASDFGLPNLDLDLLAAANAATSGSLVCNFTMGLDASGFYLDANAPQTLTFNTTTTVSASLNAPVRFAKLPYRLSDRSTAPRTSVTANYVLALRDPDGSGKIRSGEFGGFPDLLDGTVSGTAAFNFAMYSDLPAGVAMPRLYTDLTLAWNYSDPQTLDSGDDNESFGHAPQLSLRNNYIHINSFLSSFARGVLLRIADVTAPFDELIDVLTAEIPLLSDLNSDAVTILDVAGATEAQVAAIAGLNGLAGLRGYSAPDTVWWNMGSYAWDGDLRAVHLDDLTPGLLSIPAARPAELNNFLTAAANIPGLSFPLVDGAAGTAHGRLLADLLMGRPADLFRYQSGTVELSDEFHGYFPVLGPIGVTLGGRAGVKTQFGFGYDAQGVFDYFAAGPGASADLFSNGFYAIAADENGDPFTGISLFAGITAGVEANVGIARAGVEGDLTTEIGFWLDEDMGDASGRVRGTTFAALPFEELFYASGSLSAGLRAYLEVGIGPFSVGYDWDSPRVTLISFDDEDDEVPILAEPDDEDATRLILNVGLRAPRRIYGPTDDRAEEFRIDAAGGNVLVQAFDEENILAAPSLIVGRPNERGDLIELEPDVAVPARLHGGDGRDVFRGGAAADELHGDAGLDKLEGRGGNDMLYGGEDNDELMGGSGADLMDGGPGEDTASWLDSPTPITINLQTNERTGEAALDTLISIERYKGSPFDDVLDGRALDDALLHGGPGDDIVRGHAGNDQLEGGSDDDTVEGGPGDDLLNGGPGADLLDGGDGTDILSYLYSAPAPLPPGVVFSPVTVNLQTGLGTRGDADGDVITGIEILYGSGVPPGVSSPPASGDDLTGSDDADSIHGMGGADLIRGGGGNDLLYGDSAEATEESFLAGFDADTIYGDAGNDRIFGQSDNDKLYGGDGNDALDGGPGDDLLDGGSGDNTLLAGAGDDFLISPNPAGTDVLDGGPGYNRLSADYSDKTTPLQFTVGQNNAHTFPGGDRFENIQTLGVLTTGSGNDRIRLAPQQEPGVGFNKTVHAGPGDDMVIADNRAYYSPGPARTSDALHGGAGVDTISFEQSNIGVTVNLTSSGLGGAATGMTMSGFENIIGSHGVDHLTGDAGNNIINPLDSPTPVGGGQAFTEQINGGDGVDTLVIDCSTHPDANALGVRMDPNWSQNRPISFGPIGGQWFPAVRYAQSGIEIYHITGGAAPDYLYGESVFNAGPDIFIGLGGDDYLDGRAGDDFLDGGDGHDTLVAGTGNDRVLGGPGNDAISFIRNDNWSTTYGQDEADGGPGDDSIYNLVSTNIAATTTASAGTVFKCDGGPGVDTLSADYGIQTQPIIWNQSSGPLNTTFPDGSYIRNIEQLSYFYATAGNDVFILSGRANTQINLLGGDDVINPGLGTDFVRGGTGDDLVILDYRVGDDADTGGVSWEAAFTPARHERRRLSDNALLDYLVLQECERMHCTGSSKNDELVGLTGSDFIFGGPGDDYVDGSSGTGNDYLDGGPGADQMVGGPGSDTYIVDNAGDTVRELNTSGFDQGGTEMVVSSVSFTLPSAVENLQLTGTALTGTGNASANQITGNSLNNYLRGEGGNDTLHGGGGPNEVDRLHGGANADTFVLGDGSVRFYDDGNPATPGHGGYAIIEDFTPSQSDRLRLTGSAAQYFLAPSPVAGLTGTALYHDSNASAALEPATDELVAVLLSAETLTPANTLTPGTYPPPVTLESIGLTAPPAVSTVNDGSGARLRLQFTLSDPMPAGALLEIQASTDAGLADAWQTIASKNGSAAWTGLASLVTGIPDGGRVMVTITDILPQPGVMRRFLRMKVTAP